MSWVEHILSSVGFFYIDLCGFDNVVDPTVLYGSLWAKLLTNSELHNIDGVVVGA